MVFNCPLFSEYGNVRCVRPPLNYGSEQTFPVDTETPRLVVGKYKVLFLIFASPGKKRLTGPTSIKPTRYGLPIISVLIQPRVCRHIYVAYYFMWLLYMMRRHDKVITCKIIFAIFVNRLSNISPRTQYAVWR
jgi:hypothetical protein